MKNKKMLLKGAYIFAFIFMLCIQSLSAQKLAILDSIERSYQSCLDKGQEMNRCTENYYLQMDSMLNVVYKIFIKNKTATERNKIRRDQLRWLKERDILFVKIDKEKNESGLSEEDNVMVKTDKKADFVRERIIKFLKK